MGRIEWHLIFSGRVQGVGFRSTIMNHALQHGILGYVKNLADGTVELVAQGEESNLIQFIQSIESNPGKAILKKIQKNERVSVYFFENFFIN